MRITRDLKLCFPVETTSHGTVHVYSLPLSRAVFEQFIMELGETYSKCFGGYDPKHVAMTAPQMAYAALKSTSTKMGAWEGPAGVQTGLINELSRLTMVAHATENGWQQLPLQAVLTRGIIDEDDHSEILSTLVFFALTSRVGPKALMEHSLIAAGSPRDWAFISSTFTDFLASLPTSTPEPGTTTKLSSVIS